VADSEGNWRAPSWRVTSDDAEESVGPGSTEPGPDCHRLTDEDHAAADTWDAFVRATRVESWLRGYRAATPWRTDIVEIAHGALTYLFDAAPTMDGLDVGDDRVVAEWSRSRRPDGPRDRGRQLQPAGCRRCSAAQPDRHARRGTISEMKEAPMKVTLTEPAIAGSYVVVEQRDDGTLVLRPETTDDVIEQFADRPLSDAEAIEALDRLHAATLVEEG
jgi:hypothetical protein